MSTYYKAFQSFTFEVVLVQRIIKLNDSNKVQNNIVRTFKIDYHFCGTELGGVPSFPHVCLELTGSIRSPNGKLCLE
jgi:hypothetical protein